jgi:tRNA threonylcarbamoyl adenosine modification protein YjeE
MTFSKIYKNITENDLHFIAQEIAHEAVFPSVFCFYGDLGAGKTTFCRMLIRTFMNDLNHTVPSPTFTLVQEYHASQGKIAHFDFYRIQNDMDLIELNFNEYLNDYLCLIEWPENVSPYLPQKKIDIIMTKATDITRDVLIKASTPF